jgi:hypothetical protein
MSTLSEIYQNLYKYNKDPLSIKYNITQNKPHTITEAYSAVYNSSFSNEEMQILEKISGVTGEALNKLYEIYTNINNNTNLAMAVNTTQLSFGGDMHRVYDSKIIPNYQGLKNLILTDFPTDQLIITYAGNVRKLRTPAPTASRIATWESCQESEVEVFYNAMINNRALRPVKLLKPLMLFKLYQEMPNSFSFQAKIAPGIGPEHAQVEKFNETLKGLNPVKLKLPGDKNVLPDVLFNKVIKRQDVGKADLAFVNTETNEETFWISFKDGKYDETGDSITFQQWGSLVQLYRDNSSIQFIVDSFLTNLTKDLITITNPLTPLNQKIINREEIKQLWDIHKHKIIKRKKGFENIKKIHFFPPKASVRYLDLFSKDNKFKENQINTLALKAIYGTDYKLTGKTKFGPENVNIVLQTPKAIDFIPFYDGNGDIEYLILNLLKGSHIIKNPELPKSDPYLPSLIARHTLNESFIFNNGTEVILGGRLLIYPIGRVNKTGKEIKL